MLKYRFPQGQFRIHGPRGLVLKHSDMVFITYLNKLEQWDSEIPYYNENDWEEVQLMLNSKDVSSFCTMKENEQVEKIQ
jgi:hypothetical protein